MRPLFPLECYRWRFSIVWMHDLVVDFVCVFR